MQGRPDDLARMQDLLLTQKLLERHPDAVNEYVAKRQSESFEDDQRAISRYVKFVGEVFTAQDEQLLAAQDGSYDQGTRPLDLPPDLETRARNGDFHADGHV